MKRRIEPSKLTGTYDTRVFVGGSYKPTKRQMLDEVSRVVRKRGFVPIIADKFDIRDKEIHDVTLFLLHACRHAIFEASEMSGVVMEIERTRDYGTSALILFHDPVGHGWKVSRMLTSFVQMGDPRIKVHGYLRPKAALIEIEQWLHAMQRRVYD